MKNLESENQNPRPTEVMVYSVGRVVLLNYCLVLLSTKLNIDIDFINLIREHSNATRTYKLSQLK